MSQSYRQERSGSLFIQENREEETVSERRRVEWRYQGVTAVIR